MTDPQAAAPPSHLPHRVVIVAVDSSHTAEHAFDWYAEHLHRPENLVIVIHCIETHSHTSMFSTPEQYTAEINGAYHHAQALEEKFNTRMNAKGIRGHFEIQPGKPSEGVVSAGNKHKAECIVMGTRGVGTLRRTILGSVTDYVIHHAHCAVVTVRINVPI